jgi:hypothetical protein
VWTVSQLEAQVITHGIRARQCVTLTDVTGQELQSLLNNRVFHF